MDYEALVEAQSEVIPRVKYLSDTSVIVSEDRGIAGNSIRRETAIIGPMEVSAVRSGDKLNPGVLNISCIGLELNRLETAKQFREEQNSDPS